LTNAFAGGNGIKFLSEYKNYGMQKPVLGSMTTVDEGILKRLGDEALGVRGRIHRLQSGLSLRARAMLWQWPDDARHL
jgi:uncharacterized protein (UPF0264 family)